MIVINSHFIVTTTKAFLKVYSFCDNSCQNILFPKPLFIDQDKNVTDQSKEQSSNQPNGALKNINDQQQTELEVTCGVFSLSGSYLALSDSWKQILIWTTKDWNLKTVFKMPKKCYHLLFNLKEDQMLLADKSGLIYGYDLSCSDEVKPKLLMGHFSIILDIKFSNDGKYLATSDRDEKIRISNYPNCYSIESFCLGHSQFVSTLAFINSSKLVSGGGDSFIRLWDFCTGAQIAEYNCSQDLTSSNEKQLALKKVAIVESTLVVTLFFNSKSILIYLLDNNIFKKFKTLKDCEALDFWPLTGNHILILTSNKQEMIKYYQINLDCLKQKSHDLINQINQDDELVKQVIESKLKEDNIEWLYKHWYNNVDDYLKRKQQRVDSKLVKKLKT